MPRLSYANEESLSLVAAWERLADPEWEIVERRDDGTLLVGTPPVKRRRGFVGGGVGTLLGPNAQEDVSGVRIYSPGEELAGAYWPGDGEAATRQFNELLAQYAGQRGGEERLFRVELVIDGEIRDDRLVAVGEVVTAPALLDSISLTYLAALASVVTAFGFGVGGAAASAGWGVAAAAASAGVVLLATRYQPSRRFLIRLSRFGLAATDQARPSD